MVPHPTQLYRILHIDNLAGILKQDGLYAPNMNPDESPAYKAIHHLSIQAQRADKAVSCGPGGVLHDYVPFYFAPRSPMLYTIHRGNVEGYEEGQEPVIYFVTNAQRIVASGSRFVFTDGHAIMDLSEFYDDLANLDRVDWHVMQSKYWYDTPQTPDRKRRRQAEFLVHRFCPWSLIGGIAVISNEVKRRVEEVLDKFAPSSRPIVRIKPEWYY